MIWNDLPSKSQPRLLHPRPGSVPMHGQSQPCTSGALLHGVASALSSMPLMLRQQVIYTTIDRLRVAQLHHGGCI